MRTRVKFCGMTRREDALAAARLGADAIGLVFYPRSPRAVDIEQAQRVVAGLPPFVSVVALFVDAPPERIRAVLEALPVDLLQFHGDECPADCGGFGRPYIKALRVHPGTDVAACARSYPDAAALLLDTWQAQAPGGTGVSFDWSLIPANLSVPVILAGGLRPDNVAAAVQRVRPYAVDVSGGIEADKGIKDADKMAAFIREVNRVEDKHAR